MVEGMSECLEVYSVAITSPDCRYHTIKSMPTFPEDAAVRVLRRERERELQYLRCSNANISQSRSIDMR